MPGYPSNMHMKYVKAWFYLMCLLLGEVCVPRAQTRTVSLNSDHFGPYFIHWFSCPLPYDCCVTISTLMLHQIVMWLTACCWCIICLVNSSSEDERKLRFLHRLHEIFFFSLSFYKVHCTVWFNTPCIIFSLLSALAFSQESHKSIKCRCRIWDFFFFFWRM